MADGSDQIHSHEAPKEHAAVAGAMGGPAPVKYAVGEMSSPCPGSPGCPNNILTGLKS